MACEWTYKKIFHPTMPDAGGARAGADQPTGEQELEPGLQLILTDEAGVPIEVPFPGFRPGNSIEIHYQIGFEAESAEGSSPFEVFVIPVVRIGSEDLGVNNGVAILRSSTVADEVTYHSIAGVCSVLPDANAVAAAGGAVSVRLAIVLNDIFLEGVEATLFGSPAGEGGGPSTTLFARELPQEVVTKNTPAILEPL